MKKVAIIHFMPLEFYPPITNLLDLLSKKSHQIEVWSSSNNAGRSEYSNKGIRKIARAAFPNSKDNRISRLFKYVRFNLRTLIGLVNYQPESIIYYESYSVWPVYWYLKLFGKTTQLYIHYHEYADTEWYESGMAIVKYYHVLEKKYLYKKAQWISQTNVDRMQLFALDYPNIQPSKLKIMPNYPPKSWQIKSVISTENRIPCKVVYVGSLSLKDTFIDLFCQWVITQKGSVIFDIYSYNLHLDTIDYLNNLDSDYIHFHSDGLNYDDIPLVLKDYDIGVILYKAKTKNYKFNAPNKLFEYLACGLHVLYPDVMLGIRPYNSSNVMAIDFENIPALHQVNDFLSNSRKLDFQYSAEDAAQELLFQLENKI